MISFNWELNFYVSLKMDEMEELAIFRRTDHIYMYTYIHVEADQGF